MPVCHRGSASLPGHPRGLNPFPKGQATSHMVCAPDQWPELTAGWSLAQGQALRWGESKLIVCVRAKFHPKPTQRRCPRLTIERVAHPRRRFEGLVGPTRSGSGIGTCFQQIQCRHSNSARCRFSTPFARASGCELDDSLFGSWNTC
jgi:hypothetical protein